MELFGYPVRVVDSPVYPGNVEQCKWTMYRNPRDVPAAVYERMAETKPGADEELGSATREARKPILSSDSDTSLL